jgi:chitinase
MRITAYRFNQSMAILGALLAISAVSASVSAAEISAYYDGSIPVVAIPAAQLDYVIYAFAEPDDDGLCAALTPEQLKVFAELRQIRALHPSIHLLASIGGWGAAPQYSDIALTDVSRTAFSRSCIQQLIVQQGFDGLDLDWEFPVRGGLNKSRPQDRTDATALVRELRRQLDALSHKDRHHYFLTMATPGGTWQQGGAYSVSDSYDLESLIGSLDWLNVMTYDMSNGFSPVSGFNTPLAPDPQDPTPEPQRGQDNLNGAVHYYEAHGVPAEKIMLGVAFYGRGFTSVSPADAGVYSKYKDVFPETSWTTVRSQFLNDAGWVRHWSMTAQAPWLYNARKHVFFSYDDPRSMAIKADFVRREHLRGAVAWVLGDDDAENSLLTALSSKLGTKDPSRP